MLHSVEPSGAFWIILEILENYAALSSIREHSGAFFIMEHSEILGCRLYGLVA